MTRLLLLLALSGCTQSVLDSVGADSAVPGSTGARVTGTYPELGRTPQGATRQFNDADKAKLSRELEAAKRNNEDVSDAATGPTDGLAEEAAEAERRRLRRIRASGA